MALLCISDATLPSKGTGHKVSRVSEKVDPTSVNQWCSSPLWTRQTLGARPKQLAESDYVTLSAATSHEGRRNLTDFQETAQWMGGKDLPACILQRLVGHSSELRHYVGTQHNPGDELRPVLHPSGDDLPLRQRTVVVHCSLFDGCVEAACLDMSMTSYSCTDDNRAFQKLGVFRQAIIISWQTDSGSQ